MNERLIHDAAFAAAVSMLESFGPCFREEEKREAFEIAYRTVKSALEAFETLEGRIERRLRPGKN